jgi:predicted nucleotidyltransferase
MTKEIATASAREVASYLKKEHGATRVVLFGSSVVGKFFPQHSDIDLYFEGIPYEREFTITGRTFRKFADLDLDLIPAGHAPEALKKEILETGVEL